MKEELKKILYYTSISPSSHNTQPWFVKVQGNTIFLGADFERRLTYSDRENRELYISVGAAIQNTLYAVIGFGYRYELNYFPEGGKEVVASIKVDFSNKGPEDKKLLDSMEKRHSNRNVYEDRQVPKEISENWKNIISDLGVEVNLVEEKKKKEELGEVVAKATIGAMQNSDFRAELSKWVRTNLTSAHDGMPGYSMNIPTPMSLLGPFMLKNFNLGPTQAKTEKNWIVTSPTIALLSGKNEMSTWVKAGQAYERIVLDATKNDIKSATLTAAIEIGEFYKEIAKIAGTNQRPLVLFRLGYFDKVPKVTPKRTVEEILRKD